MLRVLLLMLLTQAIALSALPVDLYVDFESGAVDDIVTTSLATNMTHGSFTGPWIVLPTEQSFSKVSSLESKLFGPVLANGTVYKDESGTRGVSFRMDQTENYLGINFPASYERISVGCWWSINSTIAYQTIDILDLQAASGRWATVQQAGNTKLHAHASADGVSSVNGADITITSNTVYWITYNYVKGTPEGTTTVNVYLYDGSLVGSSTCRCNAESVRRLRFGRVDAHGGDVPPDSCWSSFDDIIIDFTNAEFPLLPNSDITAPPQRLGRWKGVTP